MSDNLEVTQQLGEAAYEHGIQAIRSPSATDADIVLAVFPENLGSTLLDPALDQMWEVAGDLSS